MTATRTRTRSPHSADRPPAFARPLRATVTRVVRTSPHVMTLTIGGPDLRGFRSAGPDEWFRLFLPLARQEDEVQQQELIRSSAAEKDAQIRNVARFNARHADESPDALARLQKVAASRGNVFAELMNTVKSSSLGRISAALYEVGGEYRRNM